MINSNIRKRAVSGWLKKNNKQGFYSKLKLQKFLFFYEALSKADGAEYDFAYLKGYKNGPVFGTVYGDCTHRKPDFFSGVEEAYELNPHMINEKRAKLSSFLISILNEEELSDLTHEFNIWKAKKDLISRGVLHVSLEQEDFNSKDIELIETLREMYDEYFIDSVEVIEMYNKSFIISKDDLDCLTEDHKDVLLTLSNNEELDNPVYISISEDGVLLVD